MGSHVKYTVEELMPHAGNIVLLDKITSWDDNSLSASVAVGADGLFIDEHNFVPGWIGIEYMAQTIAAWAGTRSKKEVDPTKQVFWWELVSMLQKRHGSTSNRNWSCSLSRGSRVKK